MAHTHTNPAHDARDTDGPAHAGGAVGYLLSGTGEQRRESRLVLAGIAVFLLLAMVAFNLAFYGKAKQRLELEGWSRLEAAADLRADQLDHLLGTLVREALSVERDPVVEARATRWCEGSLDAAEQALLKKELASARERFEFENVQLVDAGGRVLFEDSPATDEERVVVQRLVRRVLGSGEPELGDPWGDEFMVGVPVAQVGGVEGVLVMHSIGTRFLTPLLAHWPGLGASSGAYLVRADGDCARILTDFGDKGGFALGMRLKLTDPRGLAASMAATNVESRAEFVDALGAPAWAVTRALPSARWGVVGQVQSADMLTGLRTTVQELVLIDAAVVAFLLAMAWVWRRLYRSGLARREREITERHALRVQAILDTAFDAIFTFDRQGRIRTVNRAASELFGTSAEDLDGQPVRRHLDWGTPAGGALFPSTGAVTAAQVLRRDGARVPVELSLGSSGFGDDLLYTAIVRDVSERIEAEQRIRAFADGLEVSNRRLEEVNAQLEEASRLKSEFLANTSHELRTPLNGMIGFLQLVLDGMCDDPEEERDFLKQALQCSRHLLGLINDVLDIAKIEAGKLSLEMGRVEVQPLFDEVYTLTHVQAAQRGVQLRFESSVPDLLAARGDFGKIKQVLINLVGNALKFTPKGSVTVRAKAHVELGHLMFEIVDTGIGIPPERQKLIFEKFVQGDGSTTRRFGGTGLGLAISRSLVELMGGIIGVYSEGEGKGTRMYFSLPLWRTEDHAAPAPLVEPGDRILGPAGGQLVLIVEDDPVFRRFLTAVLQQSGYRTAEAENAESGWMLVRRLQPSVVVLDYALACGDNAALRTGWDLAQRMTAEDETRHIPLVFVTGFDGELKEKLRATAFARKPEHLVKPIEANVLIARIAHVVGDVGGRQVRILMADDDPTVAAYVRKVLPSSKYHIEVANNGEECLHILRTQPNGFDLLLLDLMMPEVSGYDVLREITLSGLHTELPVLVLTNFPEARNDEERRLLEQGLVVDVVAKSAVHENPQLLPHVLDWHLQVAREGGDARREAA
ncbi:MAG: response regulator [Candidatus Eisenbacteria bacterium]|uniref:histidine kinase n=1 Tax=Eiseniibacteriota bacterium TaxID=2212470 RepID=A0A933SBZ2_UNCEI|nr:response regulator [Candidatus Eisenbacteria bacterium]